MQILGVGSSRLRRLSLMLHVRHDLFAEAVSISLCHILLSLIYQLFPQTSEKTFRKLDTVLVLCAVRFRKQKHFG